LAQVSQGSLIVAVRGNISAAALRQAVAELDPDLPLSQTGTVRAIVRQTQSQFAVGGWLLGGFAGLGLLLAALGIYGVMAGFVTQRTNEIGVRMALGATPGEILWSVSRRGLALAVAGLAIGLALTPLAAQLMTALLYGVQPHYATAAATVSVILLGVAALACLVPARRASHVDPVAALRAD
jgi:putative ABC transport system permease protein